MFSSLPTARDGDPWPDDASDAFSLYDRSDSDSDQWEDQVDDEKEEQIAFEKQLEAIKK